MVPTPPDAASSSSSYAQLDFDHSPPRVTLPRRYNAAVDLLDRHLAEGRGDRIAVIDDRGPSTYRSLAARANRFGNALRALGARMEERVALCLLDTADFPACFLGAMKIGAVPVLLNTLLTSQDYGYMLEDCRARVLVVSDALLPRLEPALAGVPFVEQVIVASSPLGGKAHGHARLETLLEPASEQLAAAPTNADDVAFWLYSSGSTGAPKGAVHLHSHLVQTAALYGRGVLGIREDDVVFSAAKLFFAYGLGNSLTFPFLVGATAVLMAERPTPAAVLQRLQAHQPTIFYGVPTLYAAMLADPLFTPERGSQRLRVSTSAGEALPRHIGEKWKARFGTDILDGIGSTELLHIFLSNRHGDVHYGTTGRPVPGYELRLVGDDGEPAPDNQEGSLWVHGPSSCTSYFGQREKSLATFHGPWTRTGDRYIRDPEGRYTYSGRADDMLKVSGIWVSPFEVESALQQHEAVLEVGVVGRSDSDGLVKPMAFVVLKDPQRAAAPEAAQALAAELKAFVKDRIAPYKYPRWIEFLHELPKTATGKIQRFRLRG